MILKIKVIKSSKTCWYNNQVGNIFYAKDMGDKYTFYIQVTEYGIELRSYFDKNDIEIIEQVKPKNIKTLGRL